MVSYNTKARIVTIYRIPANIFGHFPPASGTTSFGQEFIKLKRIELNGNDPRHNKKAKK